MSFVPPKIGNTLSPTFAKSVREGNADTVALAVPLLWETIFGHAGGDGR